MNSEKLSDWASIAEIVSGIAVLVSLIFIIQELGRNTDAVEAATLQAAMDASNEFLLTLLETPELLPILQKGNQEYSSLTPEETLTYTFIMRNQWARFQSNFSQWRRGVMDESDWEFYKKIFCDVSSNEGIVQSWSSHRDFLRADFAEYVESCEAY